MTKLPLWSKTASGRGFFVFAQPYAWFSLLDLLSLLAYFSLFSWKILAKAEKGQVRWIAMAGHHGDGYGNDNATISLHQFPRISLPYTPQNNNVKSPNFRFWRQHYNITMNHSFSISTKNRSYPSSYRIVLPYCTRGTIRSNREILALRCILEWRFRFRSRRLYKWFRQPAFTERFA